MNALILVDIQHDFLPGGTLAVDQGDRIIPVVNKLIPKFDLVVATQDWHPSIHQSFASNHPGSKVGEVIDLHGLLQVLWPDHCIQNSWGSKFSSDLVTSSISKVFRKGHDPTVDSYSGFFDNGQRHDTGLNAYLRENKVDQVYLVGLATDYCVKFTALDAVALGFDTTVIVDAVSAVNLHPGDQEKALEEMMGAGVSVIESTELVQS